jgi:benzoyl-CoA reductase/2-hydroxyglutaryl-CoA dehydratase subunit BcrC/BadD/HgdB
VLKGCHPYDMESCLLEDPITRRGLKFLRLETDYTAEDGRNLLTRIEAFRQTLRY